MGNGTSSRRSSNSSTQMEAAAAGRRQPLSELTNTVAAHSLNPKSQSQNSEIPAPKSPINSKKPVAQSPTKSNKPNSSAGSTETAGNDEGEPRSVYARRGAADRRKSTMKKVASVPMNDSPNVNTVLTRHKRNRGEALGQSKSLTVPQEKKKRRIEAAEDADFIEKQRAYFAEIDAFELPEEEVASIDELE